MSAKQPTTFSTFYPAREPRIHPPSKGITQYFSPKTNKDVAISEFRELIQSADESINDYYLNESNALWFRKQKRRNQYANYSQDPWSPQESSARINESHGLTISWNVPGSNRLTGLKASRYKYQLFREQHTPLRLITFHNPNPRH